MRSKILKIENHEALRMRKCTLEDNSVLCVYGDFALEPNKEYDFSLKKSKSGNIYAIGATESITSSDEELIYLMKDTLEKINKCIDILNANKIS